MFPPSVLRAFKGEGGIAYTFECGTSLAVVLNVFLGCP